MTLQATAIFRYGVVHSKDERLEVWALWVDFLYFPGVCWRAGFPSGLWEGGRREQCLLPGVRGLAESCSPWGDGQVLPSVGG